MRQSEKKIPDLSELPRFKPLDWILVLIRQTVTWSSLGAIAFTGLSMTANATLEEVVVTARKKVESLQDTPISVTALSGDRLEDMGLSRITKLQNVTPNLVFQNTPAYSGAGNNAAVYIRGLGQKDFVPTIDPGVGTKSFCPTPRI